MFAFNNFITVKTASVICQLPFFFVSFLTCVFREGASTNTRVAKLQYKFLDKGKIAIQGMCKAMAEPDATSNKGV